LPDYIKALNQETGNTKFIFLIQSPKNILLPYCRTEPTEEGCVQNIAGIRGGHREGAHGRSRQRAAKMVRK
jgi:hypothetical protein